ncbi:hypothetical protein [Deminuibacter soli]|uniref:Uncharacterized protein n=1 Tax=Deminuibacter soli TaxID=2291815 RepID=A0A3E1NP36_9BACT|nr:hypothetical protein [Deminuibacter soli]RFM29695.1 hypothetical protein DXN05_01570 [Deminuibacter soli]
MKNLFPISVVVFVMVCFLVSCSKEKSYESGINGIPSKGALSKDSQGNCLSTITHGSYVTGKTLNRDSNYVEVQVTVTQTGSYKISTDSQNNMIFSDSGYFAATGAQTVKLRGAGKPILANITDFTVSYDSTVCSFSVTVKQGTTDSTGTGDSSINQSDTAWHFADANLSKQYNGYIDKMVIYDYVTDTVTYKLMSIVGYPATNYDTAFQLAIRLPNGVIEPGIYDNSTGATFNYVKQDGANGFTYVYAADGTNSTSVSVTIESYNATTHVATGTFTAEASYVSTGNNTITGRFTGYVSSQ